MPSQAAAQCQQAHEEAQAERLRADLRAEPAAQRHAGPTLDREGTGNEPVFGLAAR